MQIIKRICSRIERKSISDINWLRTIYFNFRTLPFKQAIKLPIYIYGKPLFNNLSGKILLKCPIKKGMIKINKICPYAPSLQTLDSQINIAGTLVIRGNVLIGCANKILVAHGGTLELGNYAHITDFCNIDCWNNIVIDDGTTIAHRCQIMDFDHHFVLNMNTLRICNNSHPIYIGKQSWICNSVTITSGVRLPNFTIVASNSLVNKDFSEVGENILLGGIPAKLIKNNIFRIYDDDIENALNEYFKSPTNKHYIVKEEELGKYKVCNQIYF